MQDATFDGGELKFEDMELNKKYDFLSNQYK